MAFLYINNVTEVKDKLVLTHKEIEEIIKDHQKELEK